MWLIDSTWYIKLLPMENEHNRTPIRQIYGNMFTIYKWISYTFTFIHKNEFASGSINKTPTIKQ